MKLQKDYQWPNWQIYLFSDASSTHYDGCLMQTEKTEDEVTLKDRKCDSILSFCSGKLNRAAKQSDTQNKENHFALLFHFGQVWILTRCWIIYILYFITRISCICIETMKYLIRNSTQDRIIRTREAINQYPHTIKWMNGCDISFFDFYTEARVTNDGDEIKQRIYKQWNPHGESYSTDCNLLQWGIQGIQCEVRDIQESISNKTRIKWFRIERDQWSILRVFGYHSLVFMSGYSQIQDQHLWVNFGKNPWT